MEVLLWVLGAVALVLLALILSPKRKHHKEIATNAPVLQPIIEQREAPTPLPRIEKAPEGEAARWMVIDVQTTGLCTEPGHEDRILEASWLILDEQYREVSHQTYRVKQSVKSSPEALKIHGITDTLSSPYSITEAELVAHLLETLGSELTLVGHNIEFDLSIIAATLRRVTPEHVDQLLRLPTLCTMTYLSKGDDTPYLTLADLTQQLTGTPLRQFRQLYPPSWRNCYFTRLCLIALTSSQSQTST